MGGQVAGTRGKILKRREHYTGGGGEEEFHERARKVEKGKASNSYSASIILRDSKSNRRTTSEVKEKVNVKGRQGSPNRTSSSRLQKLYA